MSEARLLVEGCRSGDVLAVIGRIVLASLMILAGTSKLYAPAAAGDVLGELGLAIKRHPSVPGRIVGSFEIVIGMWIYTARWFFAAASFLAAILVTFTVFLIVLIRRKYEGACGCLGGWDRGAVGPVQLLRNVVLLLTVFWLMSKTQVPCVALPPTAIGIAPYAAAWAILAVALPVYFGANLFQQRVRRRAADS
jgi:uncharacterized membrane protein YphA (DoxX/SURF4 family)